VVREKTILKKNASKPGLIQRTWIHIRTR